MAAAARTAVATIGSDAEGRARTTVTYAGALRSASRAAYDLQGERASVSAGGRTYSLRHVPSASGVKYAQDGVELHAKGADAMLHGAAGSPYRDCQAG